MTTCNRIDQLPDYVFDEVDAGSRASIRQHVAQCEACALELDRLQLTTAALRVLPDREIPQRIAFISDKVFEPSPLARWFSAFWNSAPRLGFASACVLATALIVFALRPAPTPAANDAPAATDIAQQVNEAVSKVVTQVRAEDAKAAAQITEAALAASDLKHEREHRALMIAMEENLTVLQKRYSALTMLASSDALRSGSGQ